MVCLASSNQPLNEITLHKSEPDALEADPCSVRCRCACCVRRMVRTGCRFGRLVQRSFGSSNVFAYQLAAPASHIDFCRYFCLPTQRPEAKDPGNDDAGNNNNSYGGNLFCGGPILSAPRVIHRLPAIKLSGTRLVLARAQTNLLLHRLERIDHKLNMLIQRHTQFLNSLVNIFAVH